MPSDSDDHQTPAGLSDGEPDGLSIRHGDRGIRLKWHKLRRRADDPPFHRPNLAAGLAAGASMEVDIQPLADGGFVCLHDWTLETQTDVVMFLLADEAVDKVMKAIEEAACPGAGACGGQFTANTMATVFEAMGISPMGSGSDLSSTSSWPVIDATKR